MTEELAERVLHFFDQVPQNKWYYFHKKSLDNFIYHLPSISNESARAEIAEKIGAYLTEIESWPFIDVFESDIRTAEYLYHTHLKSLFDFYDAYLGFVYIITTKKSILTMVIITLAGIFYLFRNNKIVITLLVVINIIYWGRIIINGKGRKLYGFAY